MQTTPAKKGMADHIDKYVGERVREARQCAKMSQDQLAQLLGVTFQQVQKYEKGTNRISASRIYSLTRIFKMPYESFFPGSEEYQGMRQIFVKKNAICLDITEEELPKLIMAVEIIKG